jgi:hypothetical protein
MMRTFLARTVAVVAFSAGCAVPASSAVAYFEAEAAPYNTTISSNAMQKFAPSEGGAAIECTTLKLSGTVSEKGSSTWTATPTYSNCETFLGAATSVTTNGCSYVFHTTKGSLTGTTDIECPAGSSIAYKTGSICTWTVGTQTGLSSVGFKNTGSGSTREVIIEPNIKGIKGTLETNDFFCPAGGSTGTFSGNYNVTAESLAGSHLGIWAS